MCKNLGVPKLTALLVVSAVSALGVAQDHKMIGFSPTDATKESQLESQFDGKLDRNNPKTWLKRLSAKPHHVGSPYGLENAQFMLGLFKSWGYDAQIEEFQVLFPSPKERVLELKGAHPFKAKLKEPAVPGDPTSGGAGGLPPYNAYSADGDVTARLMYVNYGMPADYETLAAQGIDVKGKIVISRYGGGWRGLKPKLAYEHGAIGCIIYSDPRDDGYYQGDVYPKGPYRNENGVQRGSVMDMPIRPGDPLTPGIGATKDATRLQRDQAETLMKIPVTAISYGDALPLLKSLTGDTVPDGWRGGLPITYHYGPSDADVHLKLKFNWDMVSARDVVAKLPGKDYPDEWVIRGNHHDGWVTGAEDPLSGAVSLLEQARCVGELAKTGWRPSRTMVFCLWDGEEPALLGSTEWVETHFAELGAKGVAYINTDSTGRGYLGMSGSHSLESFINEVARGVEDPETHKTVLERAKDRMLVGGQTPPSDIEIGALGSGSDFTPFLQHTGIAALDLGFGGEGGGGIYHSAYDTFDWYTRFDDGTFDYSIALAKVAGHAMLRLANADVLPLQFGHLSDRIGGYVDEFSKMTDKMRTDTERQNKLIEDGTWAATMDPHEHTIMPKVKPAVPFINFAPLQNACAKLAAAAKAYDAALAAADPSLDHGRSDAALMATERAMLSDAGLPGRPWFKNAVYAPGLYTGYGVKTLPGVREAIDQRDWKLAEAQVPVVAGVIEKLAAAIDAARAKLG